MNQLARGIDRISLYVTRLLNDALILIIAIVITVAMVVVIKNVWCFRKGSLALCSKKNASGIIIGKLGPLYVCSPEYEETHIAVWGGSGLGKTSGLVLPTIKRWGKGNTIFAVDVSGDIVNAVERESTIVLRPKKSSIPYNPLYYVDFVKGNQEKIYALDNLVDAIMPEKETGDKDQDFFYESGRALMKAMFYILYPQGMDFCDMCRTICSMSPEELKDRVEKSRDSHVTCLVASLKDIKGYTLASCKNAADKELYLFATDYYIRQLVRRPQPHEPYIAPEILETKNLIFALPAEEAVMYKDLLHLVTGQCFQFVFRRMLYPENKILFCLDEFSSLGFLDIERPLDKFRKTGARIMILSQSMLHVDIAYTSLHRKAMSENIRLQVILGSVVPDVQKEFVELIGPKKNIIGRIMDKKLEPSKLGSLGDYLYLAYPGGALKLKKITVGDNI